MPSAVKLRTHFSAELRRLAKRSKDNNQSRRLLSLAAVLDGMNRTDAAGSAAWIVRRCAIGCIGSTRPGRTDCAITGRAARSAPLGGTQGRTRRDRRGLRPNREVDGVVRGGASIFSASSRPLRGRLLRTLCRDAVEEARLRPYQRASAPSRPGRRDCRGFQKNFPGPGAHLDGVPEDKPIECFRTRLASARKTASCANGQGEEPGRFNPPINAMRTPICSARLPRARNRRGPRVAKRRYRSHATASERDIAPRRQRRSRRLAHGSRRMAYHQRSQRPRKHHADIPALPRRRS